jgi:uncharacterized protein (DUF885 family)
MGSADMLDRRQWLAFAAAAGLSAPAFAAPDPAPAAEGRRLTALLDAFWDESLQRDPQTATELGLDTGANARLKHRLEDVSQAGIEGDRADAARQSGRLAAIDRKALTGMDAVNYDTVAYIIESRRRRRCISSVSTRRGKSARGSTCC